jgi:hypothetical protein
MSPPAASLPDPSVQSAPRPAVSPPAASLLDESVPLSVAGRPDALIVALIVAVPPRPR